MKLLIKEMNLCAGKFSAEVIVQYFITLYQNFLNLIDEIKEKFGNNIPVIFPYHTKSRRIQML
jgi:hypothetical protein